MDPRPPQSLASSFTTLWRVRAYLGRWGAFNLAAGAIVLGIFIACAWFATFWRSVTILHWTIVAVAPVGAFLLYHYFGETYLRPIDMALTTVLARALSDDELPKGVIPYAYGIQNAQRAIGSDEHFIELSSRLRATIRACHRNLIDVLAFIQPLRRLKLGGVTTELTHGVVPFVAGAVAGASFAADAGNDAWRAAQRAVTRYLLHWRVFVKIALRSYLVNTVVTAVVFGIVFVLCFGFVRTAAHWTIQLLLIVGFYVFARFLVRGLLWPLIQLRLIDRLVTLNGDEKEQDLWAERLRKVSREFVELESHIGRQFGPLVVTDSKKITPKKDDRHGCFEADGD